MNSPSPAMRELARRILVDSRGHAGSEGPARGADRGKQAEAARAGLCTTLTRFAGPAGCNALMRRALALAREEAPELERVRLGPDGMEGFEEVASGERGDTAALALVSHLLALLVVFIGEPLTMRLVREAWPDTEIDLSPQED